MKSIYTLLIGSAMVTFAVYGAYQYFNFPFDRTDTVNAFEEIRKVLDDDTILNCHEVSKTDIEVISCTYASRADVEPLTDYVVGNLGSLGWKSDGYGHESKSLAYLFCKKDMRIVFRLPRKVSEGYAEYFIEVRGEREAKCRRA